VLFGVHIQQARAYIVKQGQVFVIFFVRMIGIAIMQYQKIDECNLFLLFNCMVKKMMHQTGQPTQFSCTLVVQKPCKQDVQTQQK
jgi:hypothetical protein